MHRLIALSFAFLITFISPLCGLPKSHSVQSQKNCIFILPSLANPYWQIVKNAIEESSKRSNLKVTILSVPNDQAKEEFLNLCQAAILKKPELIALCSTNDSITLKCLKQIQDQGIKIATFDTMIKDKDIEKEKLKLSFAIGTDNFLLGKKAAQFVKIKSKIKEAKVLILEGSIGNTNSRNRVLGFKQELLKTMPQAKIINTISADWDRLKALNITSDTLTREQDLTVVFAANDMMALGAAEAIRVAGRANQITVVGIDGISDARKAILEGRISASVAQIPYIIGKRSLELAQECLNKEPSAKESATIEESTPLLLLDKDVLLLNKDPLLKYLH